MLPKYLATGRAYEHHQFLSGRYLSTPRRYLVWQPSLLRAFPINQIEDRSRGVPAKDPRGSLYQPSKESREHLLKRVPFLFLAEYIPLQVFRKYYQQNKIPPLAKYHAKSA